MNRDEELEAWKELYRELLERYRDLKSRCTCHMRKLHDDTEEIEETEEIEVIEEAEEIGEIEVIDTEEIGEAGEIEETVESVEIEDNGESEAETLYTLDSHLPSLPSQEEWPSGPERSETNCLISYAPPKLPVASIYELQCINDFLKTEQGKRVIRKAYFKHVPAKHVIVDIFFEKQFLTKVEFSKTHHSRQVVLKKYPNFLKFFCELNKEFYGFSEDKTEQRLKGTIHRTRKGLRK